MKINQKRGKCIQSKNNQFKKAKVNSKILRF